MQLQVEHASKPDIGRRCSGALKYEVNDLFSTVIIAEGLLLTFCAKKRMDTAEVKTLIS